ncbi:hypothetical protein RN001_007354 [Aquatica leii]|uniref:Uncharacterized protein n=1 Tax=Aquatica leii TaxID=1421715 RepID=A0AAN7SNU6_9COLE|nr:hypothetical protein RN001_007354 [Aquatica leii]
MESIATKKRSSIRQRRFTDSEITLKKDNSSNIEEPDVIVNYEDEMVLALFNSMLDLIVKEWKPIPIDLGPRCLCKQPNIEEIKEGSLTSDNDIIEIVSQGSKLSTKRDSASSSRSAKSLRKESTKSKLSKIAEKSKSFINLGDDISKMSIRKSVKVRKESYVMDWMIYPHNESVKIIFRNGDKYEGSTLRKLMHGYGKYTWEDGTVYEGDFVYGFATGHGILRYPDLTTYHGEFCKSVLHGYGDLNIASSPMRYCGYWKNSQKHGKGWMLYQPEDWYDGDWYEDQRHGKGTRNYHTGEKYQGDWCNGLQHGNGTFVWTNNDVYSGEWKEGKMHGHGEYTWNAFLNQTFTYPIQNIYKGNWTNGFRHNSGILDFGFDSGARLAAIFCNNQKHGAGILVCGNGTTVQQAMLFWNDSLVSLDEQSSSKTTNSNDLQKFTELSSTQCSINSFGTSSLRIPIHIPPEDTNFDYYIDLAVQEYTTILFKEQLNVVDSEIKTSIHSVTSKPKNLDCPTLAPSSDYQSVLLMHQVQQQAIEKKNLKDAITTHLPLLYKLYNKYASIATRQKIKFKPILIRYFLWQFVRDLKFFGTNNSLIDLDLIMFENPNSGLEFAHEPFEKIYFWQFLQILVCLTWKFHSANTVTDECKTFGILSTLLNNFLTEMVYTNSKITKSFSLFECRDVLPITSVYELYKSLGEPHTVRKFLNAACVKKHENPNCCLIGWDDSDKIRMRPKGINIVPVGGNVIYLEDDSLIFGEPPLPNEVQSSDPFRSQLLALRELGPRRVTRCLTSICPHITVDGLIVNMEYPLAFIEFYDAILTCTFTLVDRKRRRLERLRLLEEAKLQESLRELDIETSREFRRSSTKVKKLGKKQYS